MSDTNADATRTLAAVLHPYHQTASIAPVAASASNTSPTKGPTPNALFEGRIITVDRWFDDFEHYIRANSNHKVSKGMWYSKLRDHCHQHQGMLRVLDRLTDYERESLRRIIWAIRRIRFPNGQPQAEHYNRLRYNTLVDMPSPDDPMEVLNVHRRLLDDMPPNNKPTDTEQVNHYMKAISPYYQQLLGAVKLRHLDEVEETLNQYFDRITIHTPTPQAHAPIYVSSGGGDPSRNPATLVTQQLKAVGDQLINQLHQMRVEVADAMRTRSATINAVMTPPTSNKRVSFAEDHQRPLTKYGRAHSDGEDDADYEAPPFKRPTRHPRARNPRTYQHPYEERFCKHCKEAQRTRIFTSHNTDDCFYHPRPDIANLNRQAAAKLGEWTPSDRRTHRQHSPKPLTAPRASTVDMHNPEVRKLVDTEVMQRLQDLQRTIKSADMLREKTDKDSP